MRNETDFRDGGQTVSGSQTGYAAVPSSSGVRGHWHGEAQEGNAPAPTDPGTVGQRATETQHQGADVPNSPDGDGHKEFANHLQDATPSTLQGDAGHGSVENHMTNAGTPTSSEPGGQECVDGQYRDAAGSSRLDSSGHFEHETQGGFAQESPICTDAGQLESENQASPAGVHLSRDGGGHPAPETHRIGAPTVAPSSETGGHACPETHTHNAADLAPICDLLRELHRQRQDLHRAEKSLTLQIKAKLRRLVGGNQEKAEAERLYKSIHNGCQHDLAMYAVAVCTPFITARATLADERKRTERQMAKEAKRLPVYPWVEQIHGMGALGLAQIVGEAGDLNAYPTVSKLWKRLGLAVINGERQQRKSGAEALEHGYSPSRRSVVWTLGDSLFRAGGEYAQLCKARKEREHEKAAAEGLTVAAAASIPKGKADAYRSKGHVHNRAKRYMEKRLVRDLWSAWRRYPGEAVTADEPETGSAGGAEA